MTHNVPVWRWFTVLAAVSLVAPAREAAASRQEGDEALAGVTFRRAFARLELERPVGLVPAGDGSDRLFVLEQAGCIRVFQNRDDVARTQVFLDLRDEVIPRFENEEGLLGLAFHPLYRQNGEFFVYFTAPGRVSVIARYRVAAGDPNRADPKSRVDVLRIPQPFWNHNGGTLAFGPDGMLYIALGDGGKLSDPLGNGQNLGTLLGSVLRIDVDRRADGKQYGIPADNPFVNRPGARGEIWAYGFRNVWGMSFDPKDKRLWAADVGQDRYDEINWVKRGGNYGWNLREGRHPFGKHGAAARSDLIEPVWEFNHIQCKSIVGGLVYRGDKLPQLAGRYVCGDHVTGKVWALSSDRQRVTGSRLILGKTNPPITSFGWDARGELFFTTLSGEIYRLTNE